MKIVPFLKEHVNAAQALALQNYNEERESVLILPAFEATPALDEFAGNGLGAAAVEDGKLVEAGAYDELLERDGALSRFVRQVRGGAAA